jgi:alcohol dehydrogenase (cytochrome c)
MGAQREGLMKRIALAASLVILASCGASAQTADQLVKGATDTSNVLNYGMGYNLQRFSPLTQINKDTAKNLVPVWNYSFADDRSEESQPLVYQGVIYVTTHNATMAVDAKTGKQVWKTKVEYPAETPRIVCCGIINRGAALFDGKVFRTTLDAHVIALDAKTGKELWRQKAADIKEGYSMTVAPLVADGVVLTGISGAEFGTRGFIDGGIPQPASICGAPTPYPVRMSPAATPGRATPGNSAVDRPGSPAPTIRS